MRAVAYHRTQPASIRLVDNEQFKFSHALKPKSDGIFNGTLFPLFFFIFFPLK